VADEVIGKLKAKMRENMGKYERSKESKNHLSIATAKFSDFHFSPTALPTAGSHYKPSS